MDANTNPFATTKPGLRADRRGPPPAAAAVSIHRPPPPPPSGGRPPRLTSAPVYMNGVTADALLNALSASNPFSPSNPASRPGSPAGSPAGSPRGPRKMFPLYPPTPNGIDSYMTVQDDGDGEQHYENVTDSAGPSGLRRALRSQSDSTSGSGCASTSPLARVASVADADYENAEMIDTLLHSRTGVGAVGRETSRNPFEMRGASDAAHDPAAEEYYKTLSLAASGGHNPFDGSSDDDDDNDYEEMLAVFMRENGQRDPFAPPGTAPRDPFAPVVPDRGGGGGGDEEVYDGVTDIGGLPYGTFYPMAKGVTKMEVGENISQSDSEAQLRNAPAGGFLLRRSGGGAVTLSMVDGIGRIHHKAIESHGNGDRLSIPPSHFHAANLEELVMQYIVEAKNDVLPCHLTVHMPPATGGGGSGGGGAGGGEGRREGDHGGLAGNAIMAAIPREFQTRQSTLLFSSDYDSPRCLRCGSKFGSWSGKKRELCHCCGVAVCGDCSSERLKHSPNVRVCSLCYKDNKDNAGIKTALRPVPDLVAAGLLTKSDKKKRSWKERFFTLDSNGVLHYYTIKTSTKKEKRHRRAASIESGAGVGAGVIAATSPGLGVGPSLAPGSPGPGEDMASASSIGDVAGAINIKDSCTRIVVDPGISEWPGQSGAGTRFAVQTDERTFYFFAQNVAHAQKWRAVLTLTAGCCYDCGEKIFVDREDEGEGEGEGEGAVGIAVGAAGLLFHPKCYMCADCATANNDTIKVEAQRKAGPDSSSFALLSSPSASTAAATTASSEPLNLMGPSLYCGRHLGERLASRAVHELNLEVFKAMSCQALPPDRLRDFIEVRVRRYAQLAMAVAGKQKQEEAAAAAAMSVSPAGAGAKGKGVVLAGKAFHQITDEERILVQERVKRGELTIDQAIKQVQQSTADKLRTEASVAMSRCAAHGVNIFCQEAQRPTKLSETWESTDEATVAEWTVLKSDTWTATVIDRAGAIPLNVTAFLPAMFERIRRISSIDERAYLSSFDPTKIGAANMVSGGSSGCWVVRTHDSKFIIKNCRGDEKDVLLKILPEYTAYIKSQPGSLLTRYLGAYDFRMGGGKGFTAVVMTNSMYNAYCGEHGLKFDSVYDLKGSIVGRRSVKASMRNSTTENTVESFSGTMKDMDLRRTITLQAEDRRFIVKQMEADAKFLEARQLMDYSLIVAIHNCSPATTLQHARGVRAAEATTAADGTAEPLAGFSNKAYLGKGVDAGTKSVYVFGIIDLLQKWGRGKVAENFAKSKVLRQDKHAISAVKPDEYALRFVTMLSGRFADYVDQ